jgi:glycosyltransferase involved in cell wall biosynthesis
MHVALNGWFWDQVHVGSGQYIRRLLHGLRKIDAELTLTLVVPAHNPQPDDLPADVNVISTGQAAQTGRFGKVWFEQRTFPQAVKRAGADLAHVPYWGAPLASPVPLVCSVLDVIPLMYPEYAMGAANRLYVSLVSTSARGADHVITISEAAKIDIEEWLGIPPQRITATYLAPDDRYHPKIGAENDEAVREKYDLPDEFVLYLGSYDRRKRVHDLLLAYTYVSKGEAASMPLVLAGREPHWSQPLFPNLRAYVAELGLDDFVQWLGYVDEADKPALYRLANIVVYPSEYEGFGLQPLEAMASGTPVVTSDAVVFDEVLEDGAYLVENPRDMAAAIIALTIQKPFRNQMINQGIAQATKYSWRRTAQETLAVYRSLLS